MGTGGDCVSLLAERTATEVAIRNLLLATDFSAVSEAALPYVTAISLRYGGNIHVVHALPDTVLVRSGAPDPAVMGSIYEHVHSPAQEKIQQLAKQLCGYPHKTYVRHGDVSTVVREMIREHDIDLLVLGTHGRTGLGRLVMGSVAEELFRRATCPVLTVGSRVPATAKVFESRHDHEMPPPQIRFRQILYATDFKEDSAKNAAYAVSLAREFQSRLTLLHVIEQFGEDLYEHPGSIDVALSRLEQLVPDCEGLRYKPEFMAEYGPPAEVILQIAGEYEADLSILGVRPARNEARPSTHFGSSIAHKVVVGANCPVLTLRN